ncbi:hypothetical protein ABEU98_12325 [Priestia megaterium]|nr:hypothetical protein [Priestia megaterium]MCJ7986392.1 hypothetical protein [Priestia sp. OVL9]
MKENPKEESRFLMENPTRSDFFMVIDSGVTNDSYLIIYPVCVSLD